MEQRISLITLGVIDLQRARTFYERMGWSGQEVEETVFFEAGGIVLVLWGRDKLAEDSGVTDAGAGGFGGAVLAQNVRSDAEVTDPEGHVWEIAYNPGFTFRNDGSIVVPDFGA